MKHFFKFIFIINCLFAGDFLLFAQEDFSYQLPPTAISKAIKAPALPNIIVSPKKDYMMIIDYGSGFTSVKSLATKEIGLAGLRINPQNFSNIYLSFAKGVQLKKISADSSTLAIHNFPTHSPTAFHSWSPDGSKIAFCRFEEEKVELWVIDVATASASLVTDLPLNATLWKPYEWFKDSKSLLCKVSIQNQGLPQEITSLPVGPVIREGDEDKAQVRTYQNLLKNPADEVALEYYTFSQLVIINLDGSVKKIADPGINLNVSVSPNGEYILIERVHRPYSFLVKIFDFPTKVQIFDRYGKFIGQVADIPLREEVPPGREAVQPMARDFAWRPDKAASLYWFEPQDGGDPGIESEIRDAVFTLSFPFSDTPTKLFETEHRLRKVIWCNDTIAIGVETWWPERKVVWTRFNPRTREKDSLLVFSSENRYTHPGDLEGSYNEFGKEVLYIQRDGSIFLLGEGASPDGDRPFLDKFNLFTKKKSRIWQSKAPYYEIPLQLMDSSAMQILIRKESKTESPNFFLQDLTDGNSEQITFFANPNQHLQEIKHEKLNYSRKDGLKLSADLYLPHNYGTERGPLPTIITAYPADFKEREAAEQRHGSPYRFLSSKTNDLITVLTTQGYAVINNASFPIIKMGSFSEPNDTFIEQLISNAEAVISEGVRLGVVDSSKVAIMGHSYGAFMTANLLTHSTLFNAGIALSGAYNRTLTPFGFQREKRIYWDAPQLYNKISPFQHADKMRAALLLIHGEADSNAGTHPLQSERYFHALKGLGATVRYVLLPYEGHVYKAEESNLHVYWEICSWLDKHLKNQFPLQNSGSSHLINPNSNYNEK